jgi:phosphomannomutase
MSRLFGTDGVRGVANTELTPELAFNLGKVGEMLKMLVDVVHRFPGLNTKPKLLKKAKALKNPIRAKFRNFYFVK